jgi:hypothetical protein
MPTEPLNCPRCEVDLGEGDTTYGIVQTDQNIAWQQVTCECGCGWRQEYDYTGFTFDDPEDLKPLRIQFDLQNYQGGKGLKITFNETSTWLRRYTDIPVYRNLYNDLMTMLISLKMSHDLSNPDELFEFSLIDVGGYLSSSDCDPVGVDLASEFRTRLFMAIC